MWWPSSCETHVKHCACGGGQVCALRLPVPILEAHMADILAALLIWSEDTKNHFKLKVGDICFSPL
jgi:hypothetical protein